MVTFVDTDPRPRKQFIVTYTSMVIEADDEEDAIARAEDQGGGNWEAVEYVPETIETLCARLGVALHRTTHILYPKGKVAVYYGAARAIGDEWVSARDLETIEAHINRARQFGSTPFVKGNI